MSTRATAVSETTGTAATVSARINAWEPLYLEVLQFLNDEAALLDDERLDDWFKVLADDLVYKMPVRVTRRRGAGSGFFYETGHFDDDYETIRFRIRKYMTIQSSWSTDPPSRTRRFVTNVRVHRTDEPDEFAVTSSVLLTRTRWDEPKVDVVSFQREDVLRRLEATDWRVANRLILIDQSTLSTSNLAIFL